MYRWILIFLMLPVVAFTQHLTPIGGTSDSIGVDAGDDGTFEAYLYPSFIQKGANVTLTVAGDTLTIAGAAGAGTADSMGVDTDGDGTIDNYLYSTTAGAFHIKKGANITLTVDTDTVTIAGPAASGTADSLAVDVNGDGTIDSYLYSTAGAIAMIQAVASGGIAFSVGTDTLRIQATLGTSINSTEIENQTILRIDIDSTAGVTLGDPSFIENSNVADSQIATLEYAQGIAGDSARVAAGDSARVVKLNEVNNPDGNKTFGMDGYGLTFNYTGAVAGGLELNATGVFTGDLLHVHQHTGNVGATNLFHLEGTDPDVLTLHVLHAGRDTLSIFEGGLSQFDSIDVDGALRVDGGLSIVGLTTGDSAQFDGNVDADSLDVAGAANFGSNITVNAKTITGNMHWIFNVFSPNLVYDDDTQICIDPRTEAAITVTRIDVTLDADPTTELEYSIKFADAFIGLANATVIEDTATVAGVTTVTSITGDATVPTNKAIYIQFEADPDANITQVSVNVTWDYD